RWAQRGPDGVRLPLRRPEAHDARIDCAQFCRNARDQHLGVFSNRCDTVLVFTSQLHAVFDDSYGVDVAIFCLVHNVGSTTTRAVTSTMTALLRHAVRLRLCVQNFWVWFLIRTRPVIDMFFSHD